MLITYRILDFIWQKNNIIHHIINHTIPKLEYVTTANISSKASNLTAFTIF